MHIAAEFLQLILKRGMSIQGIFLCLAVDVMLDSERLLRRGLDDLVLASSLRTMP
jgi:hypothetical protein